jgi:hypothetical protein
MEVDLSELELRPCDGWSPDARHALVDVARSVQRATAK